MFKLVTKTILTMFLVTTNEHIMNRIAGSRERMDNLNFG